MNNRILRILLVLYGLTGVATFGRAYNGVTEAPNPFVTKAETAVMNGLAAAALWPLYWSAVAWEKP